jgi:carbohydrate kinase (thermoresistant glucokinase family)
MSQRICVMGVTGAGKTLIGNLLAETLGVAFLEGDDLHPARNVRRMAEGIPLTDDDRRSWLTSIASRLARARQTNTGLVVACSALKRAYRDRLRSADAELRFVHLTGDPVIVAQRLSQRVAHFMPAALLESQLATLEIPAPEEHVWTLDLADTPESIIGQIVSRLRQPRA